VKNEDLIQTLSERLRRTPRHAIASTLTSGLLPGAAICLVLVLTILGPRKDLPAALLLASFWMKWGYAVSMAAIGLYLCSSLARPLPPVSRRSWLITLPLALLVGTAVAELIRTPMHQWLTIWLGGSWKACPLLLLLLSVPIFGALIWSFRSFAPTRPRAAGAAVGLTSSTSAGAFYCLHCPEVSALFVLTWYTLGFAAAATAGALVGPRLLRW
jgi:hypothetical protein